MERPSLEKTSPEVVAYIEYLENRIRDLSMPSRKPITTTPERDIPVSTAPLPAEAPTTIQIITASHEGMVKRTSRHLYAPQHRSGMGIFDLEVREPDYPSLLASAEEASNLLVFTSFSKVYRLATGKILSAPVHGRGEPLERMSFEPGERIVAILPEQANGYIAMATETGRIRTLRHHLFGEHMKPGMSVFAPEFGPLVSAVWTPGDAELFLITRHGTGIRFSEKAISPQGDWGIKLSGQDRVVSVASIYDDSGVFIATGDGKGTIRQMKGFAANKTAGGSGKIAMKSDQIAGAVTIESGDHVFLISRLGKIIRFPADEVPPSENVVQGVNCMQLRADEVTAVARSGFKA